MTDELARVLKHELTHSFVGQKTDGRCPVWLQEGIAQYMEGKRSRAMPPRLFRRPTNTTWNFLSRRTKRPG